MSRVTDEALRIATAKHWLYFNQSSGDAEYCEREAMRVALEAAIPHLVPVSVTNDPRVVELVLFEMEAAAVYLLPDPAPDVIRGWAKRLRAALANLEKKE